MKKFKKICAAFAALSLYATGITAVTAADSVVYTFSGTNYITDGSTNDITDKPLTDQISVTTSGAMNRKYAAITTVADNKNAGTFPINSSFTADGSYIYLGCANVNNDVVITLDLPEIKAGSRVTLTYAKPEVTNNGSTRRNSHDPYAYFKIADRYLSINGGDFDTWRTASVVTGEDTNKIDFCCDMWGAVAISRIEITDGGNVKQHSLDIHSTQYANLNVNGIKFYADANGDCRLTSLPEGEAVSVTAAKDGYVTAEQTVTIGSDDAVIDMPLECETDAAYYESDFGNKAGTLALDGEFSFGDGIEAKDVTKVYGYVTFSGGGTLAVNTDKGAIAEMKYNDGIYIGDKFISKKNNMRFEMYIDKKLGKLILLDTDAGYNVSNEPYEAKIDADFDLITSISGENVSVEYIGVSYPDRTKLTIEGPDKIYALNGRSTHFDDFVIKADYPDYFWKHMRVKSSEPQAICRVSKNYTEFPLELIVEWWHEPAKSVTLTFEIDGVKTEKTVEIVSNPTLYDFRTDQKTINVGSFKPFKWDEAKDANGNIVTADAVNDWYLKDFSSSDEGVITVDKHGMMHAVGAGSATITANIYTGSDNYVSVDYTSAPFAIDGITESDTSYISGELTADKSVSEYRITYEDGTSEAISVTDIPAAAAPRDGIVVTAWYDADGNIASTITQNVNMGEPVPASGGSKHVYITKDMTFEELTQPDATMRGWEIKHKPGAKYEIAPVYTFTNIGDVKEPKTLDGVFEDGYYDITFKKAETGRGDIYVNGAMVGNNVDQADADRKVTDGALYTAEDVKITGGKISVSMTDGSTMLDYVKVEKKPDGYERPQRVYIIGDSLACIYYGDFEKTVGGGRSGWGQQIGDFLNVPVTDLANSGQYAAGLYRDAFPGVMANAEAGDILLIECGYNDRSYSTRDEMRTTVKKMIDECRAAGIIPILVTPNASQHDYKPSVVWSSYLKDVAIDKDCQLIDLSKESYDFLYSLYGDNADGVVTKNYNLTEVGGDTLHSSYAAAYKWAAIVAQGMKDLGYGGIVNTDYKYTFTDTLGNVITAEVK